MLSNEAIHQQVETLLSQMTLEEKAAQMVQVPYTVVGREEALRWAKLGAGSFLHVLGDDAREVQQAALHSRLGIPVLFGIDAIHGHGLNDHATIFPSQLSCACAWDKDIAREMGEVTAREVATDGLHWTFSPVLCLGRDTRWGRVDETFGEDPYLAGELGEAIVRGYQGDDLSDGEHILACAKHYIGYGEAVGARDACDTEMTYRRLRETFLPPFEKAFRAGCATVMTAYGSIDGTPFTADEKSMKAILRGDAGFDGFSVTDWDNCHSLLSAQHVAADMPEASVLAAKAGNDMMMTSLGFYDAAIDAVRSGKLDEAVLDDAVRHILTVKCRMNLLAQPEKSGRPGCIGCEEHQQTALRAARKSITLLKNDAHTLPLTSVRRVAVIGANADDIRAQYGDWTYFTHPELIPNRPAVRPYVTIREGIEAIGAQENFEVVYHRGCGVLPSDADNIPGAVAACRNADAIVLVVGDVYAQYGETKDRADLALSGRQLELYRELRALGIPLVTVLLSSKPLAIPEIAHSTDALLCAFNGGMFGGRGSDFRAAESVRAAAHQLPAPFGAGAGVLQPSPRLALGTLQRPACRAAVHLWRGHRLCAVCLPRFSGGCGCAHAVGEGAQRGRHCGRRNRTGVPARLRMRGDAACEAADCLPQGASAAGRGAGGHLPSRPHRVHLHQPCGRTCFRAGRLHADGGAQCEGRGLAERDGVGGVTQGALPLDPARDFVP